MNSYSFYRDDEILVSIPGLKDIDDNGVQATLRCQRCLEGQIGIGSAIAPPSAALHLSPDSN